MGWIDPVTLKARLSGDPVQPTLPGPFEMLVWDGQSLAAASGATPEEQNHANLLDRHGVGMLGGLKSSSGLDIRVAGPFGAAYNYNSPTTGLTAAYAHGNVPLCLYVAAALRLRRAMEGRGSPSIITTFNGIPGQAIDEFDNDPETGGGAGTTIHDNRGFWMQQLAATVGDLTARWAGLSQGEADANRDKGLYYTSTRRVWSVWLDQIEAITGRRPVPVATQIGSYVNSDPGTKQYHVCTEQIRAVQDAGGYFIAPWYPVAVDDNNVHPWTHGVMTMADTIAWALVEIESGRGWPALVPTVTREGGDLVLTYPCRADETITLDSSGKYDGFGGAPANQGFEAGEINDRGLITAPGTISNVTASGRTIRLATEQDQWAYAMQFGDRTGTATPSGRNYGPHRGLVRSTMTTPSVLLPGETLYRWVPSWRSEM